MTRTLFDADRVYRSADGLRAGGDARRWMSVRQATLAAKPLPVAGIHEEALATI